MKTYYESGAIHNDHHKEINITGNVTAEGVKNLIKNFFDDAEEAQVVPTKAEDAVAEAIRYVMELKDNRGEYLFRYQPQWFGIYRILADRNLVAKNSYTPFESYVQGLALGELRVRVIGKDLSKYADTPYCKEFVKWSKNEAANPTTYDRLYTVAAAFKAKLDELMP